MKTRRHAAKQRGTARQRRAKAYELRWERNRNRRLKRLREQYGDSFDGFSDIGEPLFRGRPLPRTLRGPELVRTLELLRDVTGDPVFDDTLRAVHAYGFHGTLKQNAADVHEQLFGTADEGYLDQIDFLRHRGRLEGDKQKRRRKLSIREAVECVVAESGFGLASSCFKSACQQLRTRYLARSKGEAPAAPPTGDYNGDLGYMLEVTPTNGVVPGPDGHLLEGASQQPATLYWRRRFRDGDVAIRIFGLKHA